MPYDLQKEPGGGYSVVTTATGEKHSKKPLNRQRALAQQSALNDASPDVPHLARGGKVNLSGKQKKRPVPAPPAPSQIPASQGGGIAGVPPPPNGLPPIMALPQGAPPAPAPGLKTGGAVATTGPNSSGLFNGQSDFDTSKSKRTKTKDKFKDGGKIRFKVSTSKSS